MPDTTFETILAGQVREYAEAGVRPIDRFAIAEGAIAGGQTLPRWRRGWGLAPTRGNRILLPLFVGLLLAALAGGALLVGSRLVAPKTLPGSEVSIFVRRVTDPAQGVAVVAVGADGAERLVRYVPDSLVHGALAEWGTVSETGWLALAGGARWSMVLVDLRDVQTTPWVVTDAITGGIGPRWGPTGLIAADAGGNGSRVVIADPEKHTARIISAHGGLIGGGPSIVWAGDGSGIVTAAQPSGYQVVPIDGSDPRPGVGDVFDPQGAYGPGLATLRICTPDAGCSGMADGRVERVELDGSTKTVWRQQGPDRALSVGFGNAPGEYWVTTSRAEGTELGIVHVQGDQLAMAATVNRGASWQSVSAPVEAPDHSVAVLWIPIGAKAAAAVVPLDGGPQTFHTGMFAGFVASSAIAGSVAGRSATPGTPVPDVGVAWHLPSLDELIATEEQVNPGRLVLASGSHDSVPGDSGRHDTTVGRVKAVAGELHFDCFGPSSATVTVGSGFQTNPCLSIGSYVIQVDAASPIVVTATGDTSWRVVVYSP